MGRTHVKISLILLFWLILPLAHSLFAQDPGVVIVDNFKYPEYGKDGLVEFILYGAKAHKVGIQIKLEDVRLEWVDELPNPGAKGRKLLVKGIVTTPTAVYNQASKIITGDEKIHFRSAGMDVDGVGFEADQNKRTLHVRSQVRVTLREQLGSFEKDKAGRAGESELKNNADAVEAEAGKGQE